jgi:hypothetical protein
MLVRKMTPSATDVSSSQTSTSFFQRNWPPALLILGLGVTVVWTAFLGYGLVELIEMSL